MSWASFLCRLRLSRCGLSTRAHFHARHAEAFLCRACHGSEQPKGRVDNQRHGEEQDEKPLQATGEIHLAERERGKGQQHGAHSPHHYVATAAIVAQSGNHASRDLVLAVAVEAMRLDVVKHSVNPFCVAEINVHMHFMFTISMLVIRFRVSLFRRLLRG